MAGKAPVKFADGIFVNPDPDPLNEVAVNIPVTTTPAAFACALTAPPNLSADASIPLRLDPSP